MKSFALVFLVLMSCTAAGQKTKKENLAKIWLSSLDSLVTKNPPEHLLELCYLGKEMQELTKHDVRIRKRQYRKGVRDFTLALLLSKKSPPTYTGTYSSKTNLITIYSARNDERFGDSTRWISRSLLLMHELKHASNTLTTTDTSRSVSECEAQATEVEIIDLLFSYPSQGAQNYFLPDSFRHKGGTIVEDFSKEGEYLRVQVYTIQQQVSFSPLKEALRKTEWFMDEIKSE